MAILAMLGHGQDARGTAQGPAPLARDAGWQKGNCVVILRA